MKQHFSPQYAGKYSNVLKIKKKKKRTNCSEGKSDASEQEERNKTLLAQHLVFQINYKTIKKKIQYMHQKNKVINYIVKKKTQLFVLYWDMAN